MRRAALVLLLSCTPAANPTSDTPEVTIEPSGEGEVSASREHSEWSQPKPPYRAKRPYWVSHASHEAEEVVRKTVSSSDLAAARQLFSEGIQGYEQGNYVVALEKLTGAYALVPMPAVAFNIASCLERMGRFEDAIDAYTWFTSAPETAKNPDRIAAAQKRIDELRKHVDD